jgi:ABC-type bacteriocin/lantibiotic exporter with double-glycine peptidase domain
MIRIAAEALLQKTAVVLVLLSGVLVMFQQLMVGRLEAVLWLLGETQPPIVIIASIHAFKSRPSNGSD